MKLELVIENVVKIINKYLSGDYKIFLFGSWARGNALETSDLDIGILGKEKASWDAMVKIFGEIDELPTLRKIDVVDLKAVSESFRNNALQYAKSL